MNYQNTTTTNAITASLYVAAIASSVILVTQDDSLTLGFKIACWIFITIGSYRIVQNSYFLWKNRKSIAAVRERFKKETLTRKQIIKRDLKFKDFRAKKLGKKYAQYDFNNITIEAKKPSPEEDQIVPKEVKKVYEDLTSAQKKLGGYYLLQGSQIDLLIPVFS
jgi:hypothetical protein